MGHFFLGMTATNKALTLTETEFNRNGRFSNAKVVWILTDGKSNSGGSPIPVAERLINMGKLGNHLFTTLLKL